MPTRQLTLSMCLSLSLSLLGCSGVESPDSTANGPAAPVELRLGPEYATVPSDRIQGIGVPVELREVQPIYDASRMPSDLGEPDPTDPYRKGPAPYPKGEGAPVSDAPGPLGGVERPQPSAALSPALKNAPTLVFDSLGYDDNAALGGGAFIPPDTHTAAGPNHVINVVNVSLRIHNKSNGAPVFSSTLRNFFTAPDFTAPVNATFDPKVLYDQYADRWLVVTLEKTPADSALFLAVSATSDPTGAWFLARIPAAQTIDGNNCWFDYPGFGVSSDAVFLTGNYFRQDTNAFCATRMVVVSKSFYNGSAVSASISNPIPAGAAATTHQPAHMFGTAPAGVGTFLVAFSGISSGGQSAVQVIRVDDALATPVLTSQVVQLGQSLVNVTATAPQSGTATGIAVNDRRALAAVWRDNRLYFTFSSRPPAAAPDAAENAAWWGIVNTSNLASLTRTDFGQVGGDELTANAHTFFPSIAVNSLGDLAIGFTVTSSSIFPSSGYAWRAADDAAGTTRPAQLLRAGTDFYIRTFSGTANRWGDYSGAAVDPIDNCFWISNQHAITQGSPSNGNTQFGRWQVATARFCGTDPGWPGFANGFEG